MSSIEKPTSSEILGPFNNITYVRHRGQFRGTTRGGDYSVPYEITVPRIPTEGEHLFVFEPPHVASVTHGRDRLIREAQLSPPHTYTLNYRDGLLLR